MSRKRYLSILLKSTGSYCDYYPSNIFPGTSSFEHWDISIRYSPVLAGEILYVKISIMRIKWSWYLEDRNEKPRFTCLMHQSSKVALMLLKSFSPLVDQCIESYKKNN